MPDTGHAPDDSVPWFPVMLRLDAASRVLVTGGGAVACAKVTLLAATGAEIIVLSPGLNPELQQMEASGRIRHMASPVTDEMLHTLLPGCRLVYAATNDRDANRRTTALAEQLHIPACAVDDPDISTFITPAIVRRSPVQIAISTGGAAPVLARRLRARIEEILPAGLGRLARFMLRMRPLMSERYPASDDRRRIWEQFLDHKGQEAALAGNEPEAEACLHDAMTGVDHRGEVWLVGSGPGDPGLLTLEALRLMQNADSVLYDNLVPASILDRVRRDAERVFAGKQRSRHHLPQPDINAELVRRARAGERVLRLKGGDPFIFGRGGEEAEALAEAGIPFRVVPGISAASGCAAAAGIPLTHRDCAQSCLFLTGHARTDGVPDLPWETIARRGQTVVIYMGLGGLAELCRTLIDHGLPASWPAAVVEKGTLPEQRVITGTLETLAAEVQAAEMRSPALIIVGQVVEHRVLPDRPETPSLSG